MLPPRKPFDDAGDRGDGGHRPDADEAHVLVVLRPDTASSTSCAKITRSRTVILRYRLSNDSMRARRVLTLH